MPLKNAKAKGSRNERRSRDFLEKLGYRCVKAGGSLGVWDIIGVNVAGIVLCQVKSNCWPGPKERAAMVAFPAPPNAIKVMHRWNNGAPAPLSRPVPTGEVL